MVWLRKSANITEWGVLQNRFEELFTALGGPRGMMLICADQDDLDGTVLFAAVPERIASAFPEFEKVADCDVPARVTGLVGHADELSPFHEGRTDPDFP